MRRVWSIQEQAPGERTPGGLTRGDEDDVRKNEKNIGHSEHCVCYVRIGGLAGDCLHRGSRGLGLLGVWFFLTFGIVVVLAQLIPAGILFVSFVSAALNSQKRSALPVRTA